MSIDAPKAKEHRYWQSFGCGPYKQGSNSITGEINFPIEGVNRRIGGAFLKDGNGKVWVAHSGKIGGGKSGIGKTLFWNYWPTSRSVEIADGDKKVRYALIGELASTELAENVLDLMRFVSDLKLGNCIPDPLPLYNYADEYIGNICARKSNEISYYRWHGLIVKSLYLALKTHEYCVGKNKHIDLYVGNSTRITSVFEIKTEPSLNSLYKAIGQLACYAAELPGRPKKILVIPEIPSKRLSKVLQELNIECITFTQIGEKVKFNHSLRGF